MIKTIELAGVEYPLTFSFGALEEVTKKFGGLQEMQDAITGNDDVIKKLVALNDVMTIMINDGIRYCKLIGQETPDALKFRPIDVIDVHDRDKLSIVFEVMRADNERTIEAKPPKNAEPTPEK